MSNANEWQVTDGGILVPVSGFQMGGRFFTEVIRDGKSLGVEWSKNVVTNEWLNHVLNVVFNAGTQVTAWYIGLFEGNYTPVVTDTAATFVANATESTAYNETTRQAFTVAAASAQSISNTASRATFTINATKTLYGAFISSASAKSATTGVLAAAAQFATARSVVSGDQLLIGYTISGSNV